MVSDVYARAELQHESWDEQVRRMSRDTRELVTATREVIARSRACMALADESLKGRP